MGAAVPPTASEVHQGGWLHSLSPPVFFAGLATSSISSGGPPPPLQFELQSVFGDCSTGAALWTAELLLGEWCLRELSRSRGHEGANKLPGRLPLSSAPAPAPARVLELGCGVAPAAGLACLCAGADVVLSDLAELTSFTERNVRRNYAAVVAARGTEISRTNCDILVLDWADSLPSEKEEDDAEKGGEGNARSSPCFRGPLPPRVVAQGPFDLIIIADCVFRVSLHDMLAHTISRLLRQQPQQPQQPHQQTTSRKGAEAGARRRRPRCINAREVRSTKDERAFYDGALARAGLSWRECPEVDELLKSATYLDDQPHGTMRIVEIFVTGEGGET